MKCLLRFWIHDCKVQLSSVVHINVPDSVVSEDTGSISGSLGKKERFFWQYNVQAKGPKGHRVTINQQERDPHSLPSVMDPVFSPLCSIQGIKHR